MSIKEVCDFCDKTEGSNLSKELSEVLVSKDLYKEICDEMAATMLDWSHPAPVYQDIFIRNGKVAVRPAEQLERIIVGKWVARDV